MELLPVLTAAVIAMAVDDVFVNLMISFDRFLLLPLLIAYTPTCSLSLSPFQSPTQKNVHIILHACHSYTDSMFQCLAEMFSLHHQTWNSFYRIFTVYGIWGLVFFLFFFAFSFQCAYRISQSSFYTCASDFVLTFFWCSPLETVYVFYVCVCVCLCALSETVLMR